MVLAKRTAFSTVKKWFPFGSAHIEPMRGTPQDSETYCMKEDPNPLVVGKCPVNKQGSVLAGAIQAVTSGSTLKQLANSGPDGARAVTVHGRGLSQLASYVTRNRDPAFPPNVYWFYGSTGTGKTRAATEFATQLGCEFWLSSDPNLQWFDGYEQQRVAILDDFRPKGVKFPFLLRILDRYPIKVPIKGSYANWCPEFIIITTPNNAECSYSVRGKYLPEDIRQLHRRITGEFNFDLDTDRAEWASTAQSFCPASSLDPSKRGAEGGGIDTDNGISGVGFGSSNTIPLLQSSGDTSGSDSELSLESFIRRREAGARISDQKI